MARTFPVEEIARRIEALEPMRRAARRSTVGLIVRFGVLGVAYLFALIVGTVGAMYIVGRFVTTVPVVWLGAALLAAVFITAMTIAIGKRVWRAHSDPTHAYEAAYAASVAVPLLRDALPGCEASAEPVIDVHTFGASRLFTVPDERFEERTGTPGFVGTCGIEGRVDDVPWRAAVLRVRRWGRDYDSRERSLPAFTGVFLHVEHHGAASDSVRLVDSGRDRADLRYHFPQGATLRGFPDVDDPEFASQFHELAAPGSPGATLPSAALRRACLDVRRQLERPLFLAFNETGAYLAISWPSTEAPFEPGGLMQPSAAHVAADLDVIEHLPAAAATLARAWR